MKVALPLAAPCLKSHFAPRGLCGPISKPKSRGPRPSRPEPPSCAPMRVGDRNDGPACAHGAGSHARGTGLSLQEQIRGPGTPAWEDAGRAPCPGGASRSKQPSEQGEGNEDCLLLSVEGGLRRTLKKLHHKS